MLLSGGDLEVYPKIRPAYLMVLISGNLEVYLHISPLQKGVLGVEGRLAFRPRNLATVYKPHESDKGLDAD
jgi:hypothetical protein